MPTTRGLNFYLEDRNFQLLCESVMDAETFARAAPHLTALGEIAGDELDELAAVADRNPPTLRAWDEQGRRVDEVVRHPAYLQMEAIAFGRFGLAAMAHRPGVLGWPDRVPQVVKYALSYLFAQSEFGLLCPVNMTDSCARLLGAFGSEELKARYLPHLTSTDPAALWQGTQWMTERTGGSDVGASTTVARRGADGQWRLWGDKWFTSVANAEVALTLARPEGAPAGTRGLGMFLVPKRLPDGGKNAWTINRLKDKLGSRSMATGEVTYAGAIGYVVGDLAAGFKQMMEMVNGSRLSNAMRAAGLMRRAVLESLVHARQRVAFGRPLAELPLLRSNLLSMLLDAEAAASVILNGAALLDRREAGAADARALARVWTPLAKYWITLRARDVVAEAMNVRGGNGYVEEWVNPRLLRDAYLGAIWEGSANVVALDVQRAILKDRGLDALAVFITDRLARVSEPAAKPWVDRVRAGLESLSRQTAAWAALPADERELQARPVADALYHLLAGALLLAEGQALRERGQGYRKLLAAGLYLERWLGPRGPGSPLFTGRQIGWLDALADWRPVEAAALADVEG
ncbi:MAG TPA: acyl-CoA dehydrogenase family protein [Methylomirabilota bacterium]|nr:acyl-CoA dehydrogenase family protein [Methylomirabilota bacterium]